MSYDKFKPRVLDIPIFSGDINIEEFFDWMTKKNNFFEYMEILEKKKMKQVAYSL